MRIESFARSCEVWAERLHDGGRLPEAEEVLWELAHIIRFGAYRDDSPVVGTPLNSFLTLAEATLHRLLPEEDGLRCGLAAIGRIRWLFGQGAKPFHVGMTDAMRREHNLTNLKLWIATIVSACDIRLRDVQKKIDAAIVDPKPNGDLHHLRVQQHHIAAIKRDAEAFERALLF